MFEALNEKLESAFKRFKGQNKITEENTSAAMREIRRALLEADVSLLVAKKFVKEVKKKAIGTEVKGKVLPEQLIVKIVHKELVRIMGENQKDLNFSPKPPTVIMVAGLQGSGKTTFCAKLAYSLKKKGRQPLLAAADTHRPAAINQLEALGSQAKVDVYTGDKKNPVKIAKESVKNAKKTAKDVVIIDTAGRTTIDEKMMEEAKSIAEAVEPSETLFVCDAMIGQDAVTTAKAFNEKLSLTGVVLTKLDGDTRGGAALSVLEVVGEPIKFASVGENIDALEAFHPDRIASRILGMGDVLTLVEKAESEFDLKKAEKLENKIRKNRFTFEDFLEQLEAIKKMGSIKDIIAMIPGMSQKLKNVDVDEKQFRRIEAIIKSMTKQERDNPKIINGSRRRRIANGSGTQVQEINKLLKQFDEMNKMMKNFTRGGKSRMLKNLGIPKGFGL